MRLVLCISTEGHEDALSMTDCIAPPLVEFTLELPRCRCTLYSSNEMAHPYQATCTNESILGQGAGDCDLDDGSAEEWPDRKVILGQVTVKVEYRAVRLAVGARRVLRVEVCELVN